MQTQAPPIPRAIHQYRPYWAKRFGTSKMLPMSRAEMDQTITDTFSSGTLVSTQDTLRVVEFIKNPPLPKTAKPIYGLLFDAAVVSLRPEFRKLLGLKSKPKWLIRPATRAVLKFMRLAIGPESPIEDGAIARLVRAGAISR